MRIQKQLSNKRKKKTYYKYAVIISPMKVKESGLEGYELEAEVKGDKLVIERD